MRDNKSVFLLFSAVIYLGGRMVDEKKFITGMISAALLLSFTLPSIADASIETEEDGIVTEYIPEINLGIDLSKVDTSDFDFENFEKEYGF